MNLTQGIISRDEARAISEDYVDFVEGDFDKWESIIGPFNGLRRGQAVVSYIDGKFVLAKVSSINHNDFRAIDGPIVRVSNGEYSWRVDGDHYAYPRSNA